MPIKDPRQVVDLTLAGSTNTSRSVNLATETCINWYPEFQTHPDKTRVALLPRPGLDLVASTGLGPHRGSIVHKGDAYFVSGNELIKMTSSEVITSVGTLSTTQGNVSMATNGTFGNQLIIVDGTYGYIWNGATLTTIADVDFPANPTQVVYVDSYFLVIADSTGQFNISASADGTSWDALDFANAERQPDDTLSVITLDRNIYFVGADTTEVWANTGGRFPFEPFSNGVIEFGTAARWSVAKYEGGVVFLTSNYRGQGKVVLLKGTSYQVISSPEIENEISNATDLSDAYAFTYEFFGHIFYQLTIPDLDKTFVFDLTTPDSKYGWHTESTNNGRHHAITHVFFNQKHYIGEYDGPNIYRMSATTYTDNNVAIVRERTGIHLSLDRKRIRVYKVEFEFEAGVGLINGQGSDPEIMVDWSDDGGHTYSNIRRLKIGQIGEYANRAILHHGGITRDRVYRVRASDPVKLVLIRAVADIEELL